ncbi:DNA-binding transcriptional regulator Fis [Neisseria sp. Ec49-e6-T10]|uniref:DNA-binding transcriptional regulator Fis n=1 Tax=Neisseria sp. Ec49-e6-T10 TaxID=3140744 RepID=UPI003EBD53E6
MSKTDPISEAIHHAIEQYFADLEGESPSFVYQMVLSKVEKPLLEVVLKHTEGNQSKAATILGLNRNTLRKKIKQYQLD